MRLRLAASVATLYLVIGCGGGSGGGPGAAGSSGAGSGGSSGGAGNGAAGSTGSGGASATGAGGSVAPPTGVDGTKTLAAASDSDKAATCDWFAKLAGGYGTTSPCAHALNPAQDQADCLTTFPSCDATFADFEACVTAVVHAQEACDPPTAASDARASDACASAVNAGCLVL
jgi:hypothetical protein